jgi:CRP/FNR family transcriptional regulator, cyclic AMP receptor protein
MASKRAYLDHLRNVPLFNSCSTKELQTIAKATDELTVPAGHVLIDQGQMGREAFIIVDGSATVKRNGKKVATLGPGSVVGELSLLDHGPRTASVTADADTTVLVIEQRHFLGVLESVPSLSRKLLASLAGRVREFDRQYYG